MLSNHKLHTFEKYSHFWSPPYFQVQPLILSSSDGGPAKKCEFRNNFLSYFVTCKSSSALFLTLIKQAAICRIHQPYDHFQIESNTAIQSILGLLIYWRLKEKNGAHSPAAIICIRNTKGRSRGVGRVTSPGKAAIRLYNPLCSAITQQVNSTKAHDHSAERYTMYNSMKSAITKCKVLCSSGDTLPAAMGIIAV